MKKKIIILCGGVGPEHEVSLITGQNIYESLPKEKYKGFLVTINKKGEFKYLEGDENPILNLDNPFNTKINPQAITIKFADFFETKQIDLVFPAIQGDWGEDGVLQGFFEVLKITYVGCDVRVSALCMDKVTTKLLVEKIGIKTAAFAFYSNQESKPDFTQLQKELNSQFLIIKAVSLGSSVGVYLCKNQQEFKQAWQQSLELDQMIMVEQYIKGKEIEIAVLGNQNPKAALPSAGIVKGDGILDYNAKYVDTKGTITEIPAKIGDAKTKEIQELAIKIYKKIGCRVLARVDFFLLENGEIYFNEINTIPCFTATSVYPKSWAATGMPYPDLLDKIIEITLNGD